MIEKLINAITDLAMEQGLYTNELPGQVYESVVGEWRKVEGKIWQAFLVGESPVLLMLDPNGPCHFFFVLDGNQKVIDIVDKAIGKATGRDDEEEDEFGDDEPYDPDNDE